MINFKLNVIIIKKYGHDAYEYRNATKKKNEKTRQRY